MDSTTTQTTTNNTMYQQLDLEHESCLKQQLLRHAVQNEVDIFMDNPTSVYDSLYLAFIYQQARDFPLLNCHEKAKEKLEELVLNLPKFLTVGQRASKHDQQNRKLRVFVAGTFHLNFRTPLERQEDKKILQQNHENNQDTETEEDVEPADRVRRANFMKAERELARAAENLFLEFSQDGGVHNFFEVVKNTPKIGDLPPIYQTCMRMVGKIMALNVEKNYASEEQVSKLRRLYKLTPMKAIKGILAVTNPVKLLQGLISIFLARPLGINNLLQKMTATSTELKRSEAQLSSAKQNVMKQLERFGSKVPHALIDHIESYLKNHDLPAPDAEHFTENEGGYREVSYDSLYNVDFLIEIISGTIDVPTLQPSELHAIHQVLLNMIRVKEKRDLVEIDILGTSQVVNIIKELWTVFDEPIALLCKANLGKHLERMLKATKAIVKVSQAAKKLDVEKRVEAYEAVVHQLQEDFYAFVRDVAARDTGVFQETLQWWINIVKCINSDTLDVQGLLRTLDAADCAEVVAEINATLDYQLKVKEGGKYVARPPDAALRRMVPIFDEMVRRRLPAKSVAPILKREHVPEKEGVRESEVAVGVAEL